MSSRSVHRQSLELLFKTLLLAIVVGVITGLLCHLFNLSLIFLTSKRKELGIWPFIFLPVIGFISRWVYLQFGSEEERGNNLIFDEMHTPLRKIRFRLIPLILSNSLLSHFFGASVGREGVGVQFGATVADQFSIHNFKRNKLLMMGISAGFSGMFLAPLAGGLFGIEIVEVGTYALDAFVPCLVSSYTSYYVVQALGDKSSLIRDLSGINFSLTNFMWILIAAIFFGILARIFSYSLHHSKNLFKKIFHDPKKQSFLGGLFLLVFYLVLKTDRYHGASEEIFSDAFVGLKNHLDFIYKMITTSISVGAGFKGGEVLPIFIVGASFGNLLTSFIPLAAKLLAPLGAVSLLAGMSNAPISIFILSIELFGLEIASYSFFAILISFLLSGEVGIYSSQRKKIKKL